MVKEYEDLNNTWKELKTVIKFRVKVFFVKYIELICNIRHYGYKGYVFWKLKVEAVKNPELARAWANRIRAAIAIVPDAVNNAERENALEIADILDRIAEKTTQENNEERK